MHMSQQPHSSYLEITALASAANAGKECVHGEVVEYTFVYNPTWLFSHPLKLKINKAGTSLWLL